MDNYLKNKATREALEEEYKKELEVNPNSAIPHLNHANRLSQLTFNAKNSAPEFYLKALNIDSTNVKIYIDFGDFLTENGDYENAYYLFKRGLDLDPENKELILRISQIEEKARQEDEYWELHKLPEIQSLDINRDLTFKERTNFPKLYEETKKGKYAYDKLVSIFKSNPEKLNEKQMFYLLIGRTQQGNFNPYNYKDEVKIQELTRENVSEAQQFGEKIIEEEPLNLLVLRELLYCYRKANKPELIIATENKIKKIFLGMLYSGDGTCDQPFLTVSVQEEYPLCVYIGYQPIKVVDNQSNCSGQISDKMLVKNKDNFDDYLFFNYTPLFMWLSSKTK